MKFIWHHGHSQRDEMVKEMPYNS